MLAWIITLGDEDENEDEDPLAPEAAHGGAAPGGSPNRSQSGFSHDPYADEVRGWMADVVSAHTSSGAPRDAARRPTQTDSRWAYELWLSDDEVDLFTNMDVLANRVFFSIRKAKIQKNGGISKGSRYRAGQDYASLYDSTSEDQDIHALAEAQAKRTYGYSNQPQDDFLQLDGISGANMLALALRSGRCFVGHNRREALRLGPSVTADLSWDRDDDLHVLELSIPLDTEWALIPTDPPYYLDLQTNRVGQITSTHSGQSLALALMAPPLTTQFAQELVELLETDDATETLQTSLPLPAVQRTHIVDVEPQPIIHVHSPEGDPHVAHWSLTLIALYGEIHLLLDAQSTDTEVLVTTPDGEVVKVCRRLDVERRFYAEFRARFPAFSPVLNSPGGALSEFVPVSDDPSMQFQRFRDLIDQKDAMSQAGWTLWVDPPVHTETTRVHDFSASLENDGSGSDWFELGLSLTHAGHRYDLLPLVTTWLQNGADDAPVITEALDGSWLEIPARVLAPVAQTLKELGNTSAREPRIRLSRARALSLNTLADEIPDEHTRLTWAGEKSLFKLGKRLRAFSAAAEPGKVRTPRGVRASLRPYQLAGLGWLNLLAEHGLNGILADDMGLGKTLQTIAHIVSQRNKGALETATLVIAPTSLLGNWAREIGQFAPRLSCRIWHGPERHDLPLDEDDSHIVITSYNLALRDFDALSEQGFGLVVLDEAQAIKNPDAKITRAVKALPIERRLCITGTPLENHLGEIWSQFDFLMPGLLGDKTRFTRHFRTPIEKHGNSERQQRLASAIRPFVMRRRKEDVASELPPKTEIIKEVRLEPSQAKLYESLRVAMEQRVRQLLKNRGLAKSHIEMLDALLKLRQTCCHPQLVKLPSAQKVTQSAKTTLVLDMIDELIGEGRKILLFSQFTEMLELLEQELANRDHSWVKLTGRTRKRQEAVDAFQSGEVPLFLISLKAGGTGLNLTAADTVIHYDPWWNPAVERQASDRAHRIGQTKPVFVYKLVTEGTVEERIVTMQARKQALADATIEHDGAAGFGGLSADDVLSLFAANEQAETA